MEGCLYVQGPAEPTQEPTMEQLLRDGREGGLAARQRKIA